MDAIQALERVQEEIIGDLEIVDGGHLGGVAFERDLEHCHPTHQGPRCYALSTTIEVSRQIHHPALNARCSLPTDASLMDPKLDLIRRFNYVRFISFIL